VTNRWWWRQVLVATAYYASAQLGLLLAFDHSQVTPFWPPVGIALAALLLCGRGVWPAVAVGAFAVNLPHGPGLVTPAVITAGNVLAPLLAAALLRRTGFDPGMSRLRDPATLVLVGSLAMTVSAGIGTVGLLLGDLPASHTGAVWATWWVGDTVGALIVTPFLLCLRQQLGAPPVPGRRALEAAVLLGLTALTTEVGFDSVHGLRFLVFPVLAAAAVRFQLRGAAPTALIATVVAAHAASRGEGLFDGVAQTHAMVVLQSFNACVAFTSYLLAALTADRLRAHQALTRQGGELERLVRDRTEELTSALGQLGQAQEIARMGSYDMNLLTGRAQWSDEMYRLMLMPQGAPMSLEIYSSLCHPDEVEMVQATIGHTVATGEPFTMDHRLRRADGAYRWLHCQGQVVRDESGTVIGTRGTATDIHQRKLAERRFQQVVEMAPDAMVFVDAHGVITQVNQQTEVLFGYARDELVGLPLEVLVPDRYRGVHVQHRDAFVHHPDLRPMGRDLDLLARRRDGSEFPVEISLSPLETDEGPQVTASIRDVTDRRQQQQELAYRGLHDSLTGLPNRLLLSDRLARAVASLGRTPGRCTAVVFLDLDRFKWVNDSLGHDAGDALLRTVAERLTRTVRPQDTVARFGGDEFVVLSEGLDGATEAQALADRLRTAVSSPVTLQEGYTVNPTVSIGLTLTDDPTADPTALLRDADAAMYRAKEQGRDRTAFFAPEIHAEMSTRLATAGGLRTAVEQGQLRVHYQPILSLDTGQPTGVEALVRWQHPERGLLLPGEFLDLAEETGHVGALDRAVILIACREFGQLMTSRPEASSLGLSVNVSLRHLSTDLLRDALVQALAEGNLLPRQLTVEVTESADLSSEQFAGLLTMVKDLGAKVAIDDFGTGFSALSRLNGLAVDTLKVDRSFVTDVHSSPRSKALVAAMTQLSRALGAAVIAEGIEHESQAQALRELGCAGGQGFLWSKGVPIDELSAWLRERSLVVPAPRTPGVLERA
jgi:diguanylate cyclase (GGDEF)-like protein/PAS domain S-box-containing protein